uniref:hypothetical protein n=1 Tax=Flavobacterium agrisoli TaxID=2793066 RepID=UPI001F353F03|nr:hypothetical protein [Flavobacterium agrisoli]
MLTLVLFHQSIQSQAKYRKELILQIAALEVYIDYAKKGYSVVSKGLNLIGDVKKGEVNLHGDYFTSLAKINPKIRNYYKIAQIISLQLKIMKLCNKTTAHLKGVDLFHGDEIDYITRSFDRLIENCSNTLDELLIITTSDALELKDDERFARIDKLYVTMMDNYIFCQRFSSDAKLLSLSKATDKRDAKTFEDLLDL